MMSKHQPNLRIKALKIKQDRIKRKNERKKRDNMEQEMEDIIFGYIRINFINYRDIPSDVTFIIIKYYQNFHTFIYCIGENKYGQLGVGHYDNIDILSLNEEINDNGYNIHHIYNGYGRNIYSDYNNINWYGSGHNAFGQLCFDEELKKERINKLIKITPLNKVFMNNKGWNTFWSDINDKIHANGCNTDYQLGLINDEDNKKTPVQITYLNNINIKDIQSSYYTLCLDNNGTVYSCGYDRGDGGHGQGKNIDIKQFTRISALDDKNIIQIRIGASYSLFLSVSGMIYGCGENNRGQLGLGHTNNIYSVILNEYFNKNNIKIVDIKCGEFYNICLADKGEIYSFGYNCVGQCGDGLKENLLIPKQINKLKNKCIITIKCGANHSFAADNEFNYFFWGYNIYNQCILNTNKSSILEPCLMNETIKKVIKNKTIKDIFLGRNSTQIIVYK